MTALSARKAGDNTLHDSALGYLLTGGESLPSDLMMERWQHACKDCGDISLTTLPMNDKPLTRLSRIEHRKPLLEPLHYGGHFERDWSVGSFSSLARRTGPTGTISAAGPVPRDALQEKLLGEGDQPALAVSSRVEDTPWHRFPRGSVPGNFPARAAGVDGTGGLRHRRSRDV